MYDDVVRYYDLDVRLCDKKHTLLRVGNWAHRVGSIILQHRRNMYPKVKLIMEIVHLYSYFLVITSFLSSYYTMLDITPCRSLGIRYPPIFVRI